MASIFSSIVSIFSGGKSAEGSAAPKGEPQLYGDCAIYAEPR
jgi:hypothetical protein